MSLPSPSEISRPRIIGLESETNDCRPGLSPDEAKSASPEYHYVESGGYKWLPCGGKVYRDVNQVLEICTPETSNPVEAVARMESLRSKVAREFRDLAGPEWSIYDTTADWKPKGSSSVGNHESYSADRRRVRTSHCLSALCPYFVARTIFTGVGMVQGMRFELSPRARVIKEVMGSDTTANNRAIINTREFSMSTGDENLVRLHFITGESNRNPIAAFLKLGFTSIMIDMLEDGALPSMPFDEGKIVEDLHAISAGPCHWLNNGIGPVTSHWEMRSLQTSVRLTAHEVLSRYLSRAHELYAGRDAVTDSFLIVMRDTINRLWNPSRNLSMLARRLDWAAKLDLFSRAKGEVASFDSLDMEYHLLGEDSLSSYLEATDRVGRLLPHKVVRGCCDFPPGDTRAAFRSWLLRRIEKESGFSFEASEHSYWHTCRVNRGAKGSFERFNIFDPFDTYDSLKKEVELFLGSGYYSD